MSPPPSTICCAGCGYAAAPDEVYPFRCPRAGTDDTDHVMTRVLRLPGTHFPDGGEENPFLRYRALASSHIKLGIMALEVGDSAEAQEFGRQALLASEAAAREDPRDAFE